MRNRRNRKGQALAELGIIVALLITISIGAVEFGYTFFALHMVTQATAAGARAASVLQASNRGICGQITDTSPIVSLVRTQVGSVVTLDSGYPMVQQCDDSSGSGASCIPPSFVLPCSASSLPKVRVTVNGSVPRIFRLFGSGPTRFSRVETFRDEGR